MQHTDPQGKTKPQATAPADPPQQQTVPPARAHYPGYPIGRVDYDESRTDAPRRLPDPQPFPLPEHLYACTFARLDPRCGPEARAVCHEYACTGTYNDCRRLLLSGPPGLGKTSLAAAIMHQTIAPTRDLGSARFWPWRRTLEVLRPDPVKTPTVLLSIVELLPKGLLIVDQLQPPTSLWEACQFDLLIATLVVTDRPAVLTIDAAPRQAAKSFGVERLERLFYHCHLVGFGDP